MPERPGLQHHRGTEGRAEGSWRRQDLRGREGVERGEQSLNLQSRLLSKPHASNSQFRSSSGPDRKGEGRPPDTSAQPGPAETTPVSPELGMLGDAPEGE